MIHFSRSGNKQPTESCPVGVGVAGGVIAVACVNGIQVLKGGTLVASLTVDWDPLSAAVSGDGKWIAVGGKVRKTVFLLVFSDSLFCYSDALEEP